MNNHPFNTSSPPFSSPLSTRRRGARALLVACLLAPAFTISCVLDEEPMDALPDEMAVDSTDQTLELDGIRSDSTWPQAPDQTHTTEWIIRFHSATSLQQALAQAEQQNGLEENTLDSAFVGQAHAELRRSIEDTYTGQGRDRISGLATRQGLPLTHVRVLADGSDLVDVGPDNWLVIDQLRADPEVEYIEPNARMMPTFVPNDTHWNEQWHYHEALAGLNLPPAWDVATGAGVIVAVLDTGRTSHSDLDSNTIAGYDFISSATEARDGNGRDSNPNDEGDYTSANECYPGSPATYSSWHGTHVAGTIAAVTNNNKGVAGVAFDAQLSHVRVLGRCGGSVADIADAIVWASGGAVTGVPANAYPADIINMSLGGGGACGTTFQNAIDTAVGNDTTVVVAAGNSNTDVANATPANCNNVIAVAASDRDGNRAWYSNYGTGIDVTAPGGETATSTNGVRSTLNAGSSTAGSESYEFYQGTSMAAPHVAGVAALLESLDPSMTPAQIEARLKATTRALPGSCSGGCGAGLVDAKAAVGARIDGSWTLSGGRSYTSAGNPRFRLSLAQARTVQIDLGSSSVDTYLYLLDAGGSLIDSDDDGGPGLDSRLSASLSAGDYILVAASYHDHQSGGFRLLSSYGELSALAQGSWSSSGGQVLDSTDNPRFVFDLDAASLVELNLVSSVDTFLYLLDESGTLLAYNDDGGAGYNSRLTLQLGAGRYVAVAATYTTGQSGSFDLTASHGTLRSAPTSFSMVSGDGDCPSGQFLASRADVTSNRPLAEAQVPFWYIARLVDNWALRGASYGHDFTYEPLTLGNTLCGVR